MSLDKAYQGQKLVFGANPLGETPRTLGPIFQILRQILRLRNGNKFL